MKQTTLLCGIVAALWFLAACNVPGQTEQDRLESNKKAVLEFYELAINQKDFPAAEKYIGTQYIQHNPSAADGKEGLKQFLQYLRENLPEYHSDIVRNFAEGDYVILHVHNKPTPDSTGRAIVDIFRLANGKVVEHWDVSQAIPENPANDNTMF